MGKWTKQIKRKHILIEGKDNKYPVLWVPPYSYGCQWDEYFHQHIYGRELGENVVLVGHDLKSCTAQLELILWEPVHLQGRHLFVVDTPGFDDTYASESDILKRITVTLVSSYDSKMKLGGIIYLHDISRPRMLGSVHQNLEVFQNLCGSKPLSSVVIGITKSGEISNALSEKRRKELSSRHWKEMIDAGVTVYEENNTSSARNMINRLLENAQPTSVTAVEIQSEIVGTLNLLRT